MNQKTTNSYNDITIVVPVRNREAVVCETLDSIVAQTYRPLRLIVVDNGSEDASADVVSRWIAAHRSDDFNAILLSEPVPGACRARNAGLRAVETEWVMFFDSDDIMLPMHVSRAMSIAGADVDIVGWDYELISLEGRKFRRRFYTNDLWYNNLFHSSLSTLRYMARTDLFRRAGGWLDSAAMFDDAELGMRLLALNPRIKSAGREITVVVRESPRSIMTDPSGRLKSMQPALDAMQRTMPPATAHWVDLMRILMAKTWAKDDAGAAEYADKIISAAPFFRRQLWRALATYVGMGGRGAAYIYKPFR